MEHKTVRVSKAPEVRRQELLDTAMKVFTEKGYEVATMRDIADAMHVVPGLCYRYFESKQVLYHTAVEQYIKDITAPMIEILEEEENSPACFFDKMAALFLRMDGKERYHSFFHKKENRDHQMNLSARLCAALAPYMERKLETMGKEGLADVGNPALTASYLLFGAGAVIENDGFTSGEKASAIRRLYAKTLQIDET